MIAEAPSGRRVEIAPAAVVRAVIAAAALGADAPTGSASRRQYGTVKLRSHQIDAVRRIEPLLNEHGGALLADDVGLGKTYVALALANASDRLVVVAPASLLPMWRNALDRVGRAAYLVSFERLSRATPSGVPPWPADPDFVIVDEAHHARTPTTRRYAALSRLCAGSRVLLLSATPLQNRRRDLAAQLALFLGAAASSMTDVDLARYVVRRTRADVDSARVGMPVVAGPTWIELPVAGDCLDLLLSLPPPLPVADGGDGGALLAYSLVRRWASSRAALLATLRRQRARAAALVTALEAGRYPTRAEIAAWSYADEAMQLAFPELVARELVIDVSSTPRDELLASVRRHDSAVRDVIRTVERLPNPDVDRANVIRQLRNAHPGARMIAFAEAAETLDALYRLLRGDGGVAFLRARGAIVSGGALSRREALARFAPRAQGAAEPHPSHRIDLLLTTDLLSEGVNLQDASVVVHLDLPWNPARLEQRVGRINRLGSPHETIHVYALRPPAPSERLLAIDRRLRAKLAAVGRTLGVAGTILPGVGPASLTHPGAAVALTRTRARLVEWLSPGAPPSATAAILLAAIDARESGFVAVMSDEDPRSRSRSGPSVLIASLGGPASDDPEVIAQALEHAGGAEITPSVGTLDEALTAIEAWASRHAADAIAGAALAPVARARRRILRRIARVAADAPRHLRPSRTALVAAARRAALLPLGAWSERVLAELAETSLADEPWLRAVAAFGEVHGRQREAADEQRQLRPIAVIVFGPERGIFSRCRQPLSSSISMEPSSTPST